MIKNIERVTVPEGESGDWKIERFTVSKKDAESFNLRCTYSGYGYRYIESGTYTSLLYRGSVVMSDTRAEVNDHHNLVYHAKGRILLNGLGLGLALQMCATKPEVELIEVNEISRDVINLVGPHYYKLFPNKIFHINLADAFIWRPQDKRYDVVWHDIWNNICSDNIEAMKKLHRRYGHWTKWQGSWGRSDAEYARRHGL